VAFSVPALGDIPCLEWFQVHPYGNSRYTDVVAGLFNHCSYSGRPQKEILT
jgi:hypothetical protein